MILIIGGAYQGKLEYAKNKYNLLDNDICDLNNENLDLNKKCIYHLEKYIIKNMEKGLNSLEEFKSLDLEDKIIIVEDVFCGVVPMDKTLRLAREEIGRVATYLSTKADKVVRIYLGLEEVLK